MFVVRVEGFGASLQGLGNSKQARWGLPPGGAMDEVALRAANALVGNPPEALALENGPGLLSLDCLRAGCVALTGAGCALWCNGRPLPGWMTCRVRVGDRLELRPAGEGCWSYLAAQGGFAPAEALRPGQGLQTGTTPLPGSFLAPELRPVPTQSPRLGLLPGPHVTWLDEDSHQALFHGTFTLSPTSNRMAYRLEGARLRLRRAADILSEGTVTGAIQLPGNGQPLVLMAGRGATGGYALPAVVAAADLARLAQCLPGAQVTFYPLSLAEAQARWAAQLDALQTGICPPEEAALAWV